MSRLESRSSPRPSLRVISSHDRFVIRELHDSQEILDAEACVRRAYEDSGKSTPWMSLVERQTDDSRDRFKVLGFFYGSQCVGSVVLYAPRATDGAPFAFLPEHVQREGILRGVLPAPDDCLEVGRLALEQPFRGTGLIRSVFQRLHRELRLSGRSRLLISSDARLMPKYRSVTFRPLGLTYFKKQREGVSRLEVMVSRQKHFGSYGIGLDPIRWCLFVDDVVRSLESEGLYQPRALERILYPIFRSFRPVSRIFEHAWLAQNQLLKPGLQKSAGAESLRVERAQSANLGPGRI